MVGQTVVEIIGHIIYSFTRSVAEHYDFDEIERSSYLIGYNPLEDTGLEWHYCQPVDDLIYQEYSNREATTFDYLETSSVQARLIDACSTEENDESTKEVTEDRGMAWKRLRPSIFSSVWKSFFFGFLISISSATLVGIVSIMIYYLSYQTMLKCDIFSAKQIPVKIQWMKTTSEVVKSSVYFYWFFTNTLFYFRSFQISGLKLKLFLFCLAFYIVDALQQIFLQVFGISPTKLTPVKNLPILQITLLFLCVSLQVFITVKHLCRGPRRKTQCKMFVLTLTPYVLTYVTAIIIIIFIYPAYRGESKSGKMLIAIFTPLIALVSKSGFARLCSAVVTKWPSGNFICAVSPTVLWDSGNAEAFTSGSGNRSKI